jgi:antitoxin HicB
MKSHNSSEKVTAKVFPYSVTYESYGENDSQYEVSFRDFPYIVGEGETVEKAVREAQGNLQAILDDMVKDGKEIKKPFCNDASKEPSGKITVRMTKTLHCALIERAETEGMSLNSVVIDAISSYVYRPSFEMSFHNLVTDCRTNVLENKNESLDLKEQMWDKKTSSYPADKTRGA